ncbi:hypothetical protein Pmani_018662 [Petrolisthes manimaculis]|uniref:Adenine phosphoribosyltransferase n=1 Tax=Petrolisthes manimaculis TaxID=1843537 RepID=A0AAE1PJZ0_9EUCA|nr:hypothetical protein Pmani_018662 [Petrolisthes manimaculis]
MERTSDIPITNKNYPHRIYQPEDTSYRHHGIIFKDIFSVLLEPRLFRNLMAVLEERVRKMCPGVQAVVGLESRGFLIGTPLALALDIPFVPIRKKGKLPGKVKQVSYTLEYGTDVFEAQESSIKKGQKVVILDDLLATGGTMKAACDLITAMGGEVLLCLVCIELLDLKGCEKFSHPFDAVVKFSFK